MRKLKIIEHISLDGVIQHSADDGDFPYSDWTAPYRTPAGRDAMIAAYGGSFDLLLGRHTYDIWSGFWPKAPSSPMADGLSRLEMSRFLAPPVVADHRNAPVNALGYLRVMFAVEDIDDTLARLGKRGAELVGEVVQYENTYRLCYIRGPEGILIGLAQELGQQASR